MYVKLTHVVKQHYMSLQRSFASMDVDNTNIVNIPNRQLTLPNSVIGIISQFQIPSIIII